MRGSMRVKRAQWGSPLHYRTVTYKVYKRGIHFEACVFAAGITHTGKRGYACSSGTHTNPRKAIGDAFVRAGQSIMKRGGAFAGFTGYSRKNRRTRRTRRYSKRRY